MIEIYDRLTADCKSINQHNAIQIALETTMTPAEVVHLSEGLSDGSTYWSGGTPSNTAMDRQKFKANAQQWIDKLQRFHDMSQKSRVEPFQRAELLRSLTRYSGEGYRRDKVLIVFFCGSGHVPMMPTASFLQCLDAGTVDVAMVRDYRKQGFRTGIDDLADGMEGVWAALSKGLRFSEYRRVCTIGVSGGGLMAIMTALHFGLETTMAVGPNSPDEARWTYDGVTGRERLRAVQAGQTGTRILVLYGSHEPRDFAAAQVIAETVPAELMEVAVPGVQVYHNALYPLLADHRLPAFLAEQLRLPLGPEPRAAG